MVNSDILEKLVSQDWKSIYPALVAHAINRVNRFGWRSTKDELPGGLEPRDIARKAIEAVFDGRRRWNPDKQPDLLFYLKGIINSYVYHLLYSAGHLRRVYSPQSIPEEGQIEIDIDKEVITPLDELMAKDLLDYLWNAAKGDGEIEAILVCADNGIVKRSEIAKEFGYSVDEITKAKKRLRRLYEKYQKEQ